MRTINEKKWHHGIGFIFLCLILFLCKDGNCQINRELPGDIITGFTIIEKVENSTEYWDWDLHLEVYYQFNFAHEKVIVGANIPGITSGHSYWGYESGPYKAVEESRNGDIIYGKQRVNLAVKLDKDQQITEYIRLFMNEPNGTEFISKLFNHQSIWTYPTNKSVKATLPDLVISKVETIPYNPVSPKSTVQIKLYIKNQGNYQVNGVIYANVSGNWGGYITDGLNPGETKVVTIDYVVYSPAVTYTLYGTVNPDNVNKESNYNNNISQPIIITTTW